MMCVKLTNFNSVRKSKVGLGYIRVKIPMDKLKKNIIAFLKEKGDYEEGIDLPLIDEYISNVDFCVMARKHITEEGMVQTEIRIAKGGVEYEIAKRNAYFDIYNKSLSNIKDIVSKLGISPSDRIKLKLISEEGSGDALTEFDN